MSNSKHSSSYQDLASNMKTNEERQEDTSEKEEETSSAGTLGFASHAEVETQLAKVEAERDELKNKYLQAHADMENLRRRTEKDMNRAHKFAIEKFAQELLPVIDSLEKGLALDAKGDELAIKIHEGMQLTLDMLSKTLEKFYIKPLVPKHGEAFNADLHEAMVMQPSPNATPNTILQVLQKGYMLHDRLLRPALVVVAK